MDRWSDGDRSAEVELEFSFLKILKFQQSVKPTVWYTSKNTAIEMFCVCILNIDSIYQFEIKADLIDVFRNF